MYKEQDGVNSRLGTIKINKPSEITKECKINREKLQYQQDMNKCQKNKKRMWLRNG